MERVWGFIKHPPLWPALLIGLLVRLVGVSWRPIWYDEAIALIMAQRTFTDFLYATITPVAGGVANVHPPGYFFSLMVWADVFGSSVLAGRLFSILFGMLLLGLAFKLAEMLLDRDSAGMSRWLLIFSPLLVHYSQEIRMYSMMTFGVLLAAVAYWKWAEGDGRRLWYLAFAIGAATAQYAHNLAALHLIVLATWPLVTRNWRMVRFVAISGLGAIVLYLPWMFNLLKQVSTVTGGYWISKPAVTDVLALLQSLTSFQPLPMWGNFIVLFAYVFLLTSMIMSAMRRQLVEVPDAVWWLAWMSVMPVFLSLLFSQWVPIFLLRTLLPVGVFCLLLLAWLALNQVRDRFLQSVSLGFLMLGMWVGLGSFYIYADTLYGPYAELAEMLKTQVADDEAILHASKFSIVPVLYYEPQLEQSFVLDLPGTAGDNLLPSTREVLGVEAHYDFMDGIRGSEGVWFIIFQQHLDLFTELTGATGPELQWLTENMELIEQREWGENLLVYHFQKR